VNDTVGIKVILRWDGAVYLSNNEPLPNISVCLSRRPEVLAIRLEAMVATTVDEAQWPLQLQGIGMPVEPPRDPHIGQAIRAGTSFDALLEMENLADIADTMVLKNRAFLRIPARHGASDDSERGPGAFHRTRAVRLTLACVCTAAGQF
jgi:hypothetical protein